jgi:hypothetical protein
MRVVRVNVPNSAREPQSRVQQQSRTESVGFIDGKCMGIVPPRTALTGIGKVFETIEARP